MESLQTAIAASSPKHTLADNAITVKSGILDLLEPGDCIMADKEFTLSNSELQPRGLELVVPPFCRGGGAFTAPEVETTKEVANRRIVVENCIMRTRVYRILRTRLPVLTASGASHTVQTCGYLSNLQAPIR